MVRVRALFYNKKLARLHLSVILLSFATNRVCLCAQSKRKQKFGDVGSDSDSILIKNSKLLLLLKAMLHPH